MATVEATPIYKIEELKQQRIVQQLVEFAEANPFDLLVSAIHPDNIKRYAKCVQFYEHYLRICYTIDCLGHQKARHLSIGSMDDKPLPDDSVIQEIVRLFFSNPTEISTVLHTKARVRQFIEVVADASL